MDFEFICVTYFKFVKHDIRLRHCKWDTMKFELMCRVQIRIKLRNYIMHLPIIYAFRSIFPVTFLPRKISPNVSTTTRLRKNASGTK